MAEGEKESLEESEEELEGEEFGELIKYTAGGFVGGLILGGMLDYFGFHKSGIGQWVVRTLSGEGESIFEGIFSLRKRISGAAGSMAEAYGWGKLLGMIFPWVIDWGSRLLGVDVYGIEAFYIPYFYALSDQIGANVSGFLFLRRREGALIPALSRYLRHPVMIAGLSIILLVPAGLLIARVFGFVPDTQTYTAIETIAANLCWVPPLVGWLAERGRSKSLKD
ncbi:MAG: hypothetical protein JSU92_00030 [Deltaproteobacteria bacterium]|nr:MAG: hypothetical protein JSU92_00030 [Deltaproteobacteria bacterium]